MSATKPGAIGYGPWWPYACYHLLDMLRGLLQQLERGDARLTIDPVAWENTMAVFEYMMEEFVAGRMRGVWPVNAEHLKGVRRLRVLGREALAGGPRPDELVPLIKKSLCPSTAPTGSGSRIGRRAWLSAGSRAPRVPARSWFHRSIEVFPPRALREAVAYLGPASRVELIEGELGKLRREIEGA